VSTTHRVSLKSTRVFAGVSLANNIVSNRIDLSGKAGYHIHTSSVAITVITAMLVICIFQGIHRIVSALISIFKCRFLHLNFLMVMVFELIFGLDKEATSLVVEQLWVRVFKLV
jgi:hypothetical protein